MAPLVARPPVPEGGEPWVRMWFSAVRRPGPTPAAVGVQPVDPAVRPAARGRPRRRAAPRPGAGPGRRRRRRGTGGGVRAQDVPEPPGNAARMASGRDQRNSVGTPRALPAARPRRAPRARGGEVSGVGGHRRTNVTGFHPARRPAIFPRVSAPPSPDEDRAVSNESLSVTDNRTGKSYELPIADGTIKAIDLRQIKTGGRRFRPDDLRSGLHEHRRLPERHHLHRRRQGDPPLPRLSHRAAGREGQLPRGGVPAGRGGAAQPRPSWTSGSTTSGTTPTSTPTSSSSWRGSATTPTRWACCSAWSARSRPSTPTPRTSTTRPTATSSGSG